MSMGLMRFMRARCTTIAVAAGCGRQRMAALGGRLSDSLFSLQREGDYLVSYEGDLWVIGGINERIVGDLEEFVIRWDGAQFVPRISFGGVKGSELVVHEVIPEVTPRTGLTLSGLASLYTMPAVTTGGAGGGGDDDGVQRGRRLCGGDGRWRRGDDGRHPRR